MFHNLSLFGYFLAQAYLKDKKIRKSSILSWNFMNINWWKIEWLRLLSGTGSLVLTLFLKPQVAWISNYGLWVRTISYICFSATRKLAFVHIKTAHGWIILCFICHSLVIHNFWYSSESGYSTMFRDFSSETGCNAEQMDRNFIIFLSFLSSHHHHYHQQCRSCPHHDYYYCYFSISGGILDESIFDGGFEIRNCIC
jgi:hypothetical protein